MCFGGGARNGGHDDARVDLTRQIFEPPRFTQAVLLYLAFCVFPDKGKRALAKLEESYAVDGSTHL